MKLYKYIFSETEKKVEVEELEVVENGTAYSVLHYSGWQQQIAKEEIDKMYSHPCGIVVLSERDFDKAKTFYLARLQKEILLKQEFLTKLRKHYEDICDMEEI